MATEALSYGLRTSGSFVAAAYLTGTAGSFGEKLMAQSGTTGAGIRGGISATQTLTSLSTTPTFIMGNQYAFLTGAFGGDGKNLTNITVDNMDAPGTTYNVEYKGSDGTFEGYADMLVDNGNNSILIGESNSQNFQITGSLKLSSDAFLAGNAYVGGGLGASGVTITSAGAISADGRIVTDSTTDATTKTDGSLQTDGGLSVAKAIYNGTAATLAADSGVVTIGSTTAATFSAAGLLNVNNATEATSTTDGSLQTDGGLSVAQSAVIGDDLDLLSDAAILNFGADQDVNLTHVADTGILLNSTMAIQFNDSSQYIKASSAADLDLAATTDINMDCTTVDVNAALDVSGATTLNGAVTLGDGTGDDITVTGRVASHVVPKTDSTYDLGTASLRWQNVYTGDLHLRNERGDWTLYEESDHIKVRNNLTGKMFRMALIEDE